MRHLKWSCLFFLVLSTLMLPPLTVRAADLQVGCSVNESIAAINNANANPDADVIELPQNCTLTFSASDNTTAHGANALPVVTTDVTINGNGAILERSSAADTPAFRFFEIESTGVLHLERVTLRNGLASFIVPTAQPGGALYNAGTTYLIKSFVIQNAAATPTEGSLSTCYSGGHGGGIYNTSTLVLAHTTVDGNRGGGASQCYLYGWEAPGDGGGIYSTGDLSIDDSHIENNSAGSALYGGNGGGIYSSGTLSVKRSVLQYNQGGRGSAISYHAAGDGGAGGAIFASGTSTIETSLLQNNHAGDARAGGMSRHNGGNGGGIANSGSMNLRQTTLRGNTAGDIEVGNFAFFAAGIGGGIYNQGTLQISDSTLNQNHSGLSSSPTVTGQGAGGGLANTGTTDIVNTTITQNNAPGTAANGGGIFNSGTVDAVNLTVVENGAAIGGNISTADYALTLRNSIIANRTAGTNCSGVVIDGGGNLRWAPNDTTCSGLYGDPKLNALTDNGGSTETMLPQIGSAALGIGVKANCPANDQRGAERAQTDFCDAGAVEIGLITVQQDDARVRFGGWALKYDATASGGAYRASDTRGDTARYMFYGDKIVWITRLGPGQGKAHIKIDDQLFRIVDLYSLTPQPQAHIVLSGLGSGAHSLTIRVSGRKNRNATGAEVVVDAFQQNHELRQETARRLAFSGWKWNKSLLASGLVFAKTDQSHATATFTFQGTRVFWLTTKGPRSGIAEVWLDGMRRDIVDLYLPTRGWTYAYGLTNLLPSAHVLQIRVRGAKNSSALDNTVIIDGFRGDFK